MHNHPSVDMLCRILGLAPADLEIPHRLLRVHPFVRDPATIEQAASECFQRVRAAQAHLPHETFLWMMQTIGAARTSLLSGVAMPQHDPVATSMPQIPQFPTGGPVRHRRGTDWENLLSGAAVILGMVVAILLAGLFLGAWEKDVIRPGRGGRIVATKFRPEPEPIDPQPIVPRGEGAPKQGDPIAGNGKGEAPREDGQRRGRGDVEAADRLCDEALEQAKNGSFVEADLRAAKALKAAPGHERAEAMRLLVAYQRQYTDLADEALEKLNGNNVVNLGPDYGDGAFIEKDASSVTFKVAGRIEQIPIGRLNGIPGVRFRITRDYLGNAANPANDLILGAYHYVSGLTDDGAASPPRALQQAHRRWKKAAGAGDADARVQAEMLLQLPQRE